MSELLLNLTSRIHIAIKNNDFPFLPWLGNYEKNLNFLIGDLFKEYIDKGYEPNTLKDTIQQALDILIQKKFIRIQKDILANLTILTQAGWEYFSVHYTL